jgi:hypothetical protein
LFDWLRRNLVPPRQRDIGVDGDLQSIAGSISSAGESTPGLTRIVDDPVTVEP